MDKTHPNWHTECGLVREINPETGRAEWVPPGMHSEDPEQSKRDAEAVAWYREEERIKRYREEQRIKREEERAAREPQMAAFMKRIERDFEMAALMLHPLNGRVDFALHAGELVKKDAAYSIRLTPALVMAMLRRENELRLSEDVQASYGASGCLATFVSITERVQRQVVGEFGFEGEEAVSAALDGIRGCEALWPERAAEFRELSHYRKFNRARGGELSALDRVPDVPLGSLAATGEETDTSLAAELTRSADEPPRPTLIVAGSYS